MPNLQNLEVYISENRTWTLYARDAYNNPLDITTYTLDMRVGKPPQNMLQRAAAAEFTGAVINGAAGSYSASWTPNAVSTPGDYTFQTVGTDTGTLGFVNNAGGPITWLNDAGGVITFLSDAAGSESVVTYGRLTVKRTVA